MLNQLNDLTNKEWLVTTKSIWMDDEPRSRRTASLLLQFGGWLLEQGYNRDELSELLGQPMPSLLPSTSPRRGELKSLHPATFPEPDIEKLILFFTKRGELVLDPFVGTGTTCIAALKHRRRSLGVDLFPHWIELAKERVLATQQGTRLDPLNGKSVVEAERLGPILMKGDAAEIAKTLVPETVDFIVTSPPYWGILNKKPDHKVKSQRLKKSLPTNYGEDASDLSNIEDYGAFVEAVAGALGKYRRVLRPRRYACVIVSDFRHRSRFYSYHSDLARAMEGQGFTLEGITILAQNSKGLYPYGIPYAFVSNIHHQYVLVLRNGASSETAQ